MSWKVHDGQAGLHANIVKALEEDGMMPQYAQQKATEELLNLQQKGPGVYDVHAGTSVFRVRVKE